MNQRKLALTTSNPPSLMAYSQHSLKVLLALHCGWNKISRDHQLIHKDHRPPTASALRCLCVNIRHQPCRSLLCPHSASPPQNATRLGQEDGTPSYTAMHLFPLDASANSSGVSQHRVQALKAALWRRNSGYQVVQWYSKSMKVGNLE